MRRPLGEALPHVVSVISPVGVGPLGWRGEAQSLTAASGDGGVARRVHTVHMAWSAKEGVPVGWFSWLCLP